MGASASAGYREYKGERDVYRNDVIALVFSRLCDVSAHIASAPVRRLSIRSDRNQTGAKEDAGAKEDLATFLVGQRWFAARTGELVEAIDVANIMPLPFMPPGMIGCLMYRGSPLPVLDLRRLIDVPARSSHAAEVAGSSARTGQIVVMTASGGVRFGVLVDDLGEIVEVLANRLTPLPAMVANRHMFADAAFAANSADEGDLVVVLRADLLYESLSALDGRAGELSAA